MTCSENYFSDFGLISFGKLPLDDEGIQYSSWKEVYDNLKPNYTSYKFADMLNVGLVMKGIKKSALVHIEDKNNLLNRLGLYHMTYPKKGLEHLTLLSKKEINITHNEDIDVNTGKILGYLTPGNLESFTKTDKNTERKIY